MTLAVVRFDTSRGKVGPWLVRRDCMRQRSGLASISRRNYLNGYGNFLERHAVSLYSGIMDGNP
jgi:hypothetical protein